MSTMSLNMRYLLLYIVAVRSSTLAAVVIAFLCSDKFFPPILQIDHLWLNSSLQQGSIYSKMHTRLSCGYSDRSDRFPPIESYYYFQS